MNDIYQNQRNKTGQWGERVAVKYALAHGYRIVATHVWYRDGEVDVVAVKGGVLFFMEVKTRANERYGTVEAVTRGKRARLMRAAQRFCMSRGLAGAPCQFDCLVVLGRAGDSAVTVRHYRNI
ncbi:MAG: YraN family protein [Patescibacteria group bacterium]